MNQSQLARELGVSRARVSQLAKEGMPVDSLMAAVDWRRRCLDPSWTVDEPVDPAEVRAASAELQRERSRMLRAKRIRLEMLTQQRRGQLVEQRKVVEALERHLLSIPANCAELSPTGQFRTVCDAIDREIGRAVAAFKADLGDE